MRVVPMLDYVHHVPGRLRVAARRFRADTAVVTALCRELEATPGIVSVLANELTGSLTIRYQAGMLEASAIAAKLSALTGMTVDLPARADSGRFDYRTALGKRLGKALLTALLERLLERSTARLLAALV
jgi:prophage DNA circulation protein